MAFSPLSIVKIIIKYIYRRMRYGADIRSADFYCMFIGYPRSGHSLIGSLLDAHPNIIISHELNVLKKLYMGWKEQRIYTEIRLFLRELTLFCHKRVN